MKSSRNPVIALIDYGMGNLRSVQKALEKVGGRVQLTDSPRVIRSAKAVVLPGVGAFGQAAKRLRAKGLDRAIQDTLNEGKPFLGICLGLQLLFERSEENPGIQGLGFFKGSVVRFRHKTLKVPHMGWNNLSLSSRPGSCLKNIGKNDHFYFVHSYFPAPKDKKIIAATTRYGSRFCSAAAQGPVTATQFHPEKSGRQGLRLLSNFVRQVKRCS